MVFITGFCGAAAGAAPDGTPPVALAASASPAPSWEAALDAAWQRSLDATDAQGQQQRAAAEQARAGAWLSAPPALELAQREGQGRAARGTRETELGIVLPLWRWGQRDAAAEAGRTEAALAAAQALAARLRLAAQLGDSAAALLSQEEEARRAHAQATLLQRLSADVERRVKAGDLAPADGWAARAEWLAARAQVTQQERQLLAQRSQWQLLTGWAVAPAWPAAPAEVDEMTELPLAHPELQQVALATERARRRLALAEASRGEAPEVALGVRDERPGSGDPSQRSLGIALRVPFGGTTHTQPRLAGAQADQALAIATEQRTQERLRAALAVARLQRQSTSAQAELDGQRAALLRERAQHLQKSFDAGESSLPELLRALIAAAEAESASARQHIAAGLARLRVQHALGITP